MTVYLSLVFILLISLAAALLESVSVQLAKNYRRADVDRAAESMFAEYQQELLEEYGIFGLDAGYETGSYEESLLTDRLAYYGGGSGMQKIKKIRFLTDQGGREFYEQAVKDMESRYGLDLAERWLGTTALFNSQETRSEELQTEEKEKQEELKGLLEINEGELPKEENPIEHISVLRQSPVLSLVLPKDREISEKQIDLGETLGRRSVNRGYGSFDDTGGRSGKAYDLLFGAYLLEYFSAFTDEKKTGAMDYELEYILEGKGSDRENLEAVVKKLQILRFVPNYVYIQTDPEMKAEAEAMALTLCSILAVPAVTEAAAQVILLAWAYGETVMDIRSLMAGNRVPLVKTKESWQLTLPALLKLGTGEDSGAGRDQKEGLEYRDYLRMLLFLESAETSAVRAMDMIEKTLREVRGMKFFHADYCVSRIEIESVYQFRRGITYSFSTRFGYQ